MKSTPKKIISLVPSQTELLHYLGLENEVIGITKFCIHPLEWYRTKVKVGGTKIINFKTIQQLQPDLIIANKEENLKEEIESLQQLYPVHITDVNNLTEAYEMIKEIGKITKTFTKAKALIEKIKNNLHNFQSLISEKKPKTVCYLIWKEPYMTVGSNTFINEMLEVAGFTNVFKDKLRYPQITLEELIEKQPDYIFLSSEPYPFKEKHIIELQKNAPELTAKMVLVDGEVFSWYGSRMLHSADYFKQLATELSIL